MAKEIILEEDKLLITKTNEEGEIIYVNEEFCRISKYDYDSIIGKNHNIFRHCEMPKEVFEDLWKTLKSGMAWKGIVKNITKSGDYYWVKAIVYPSVKINGEVNYISVRKRPSKEEISQAIKSYLNLK